MDDTLTQPTIAFLSNLKEMRSIWGTELWGEMTEDLHVFVMVCVTCDKGARYKLNTLRHSSDGCEIIDRYTTAGDRHKDRQTSGR